MKDRKRLVLFLLLILDAVTATIFLPPQFLITAQNTILLLTGAIVLWYTYETYLLRRDAQANTLNSLRPILVLDEEGAKGPLLMVHNVGHGAAINIEVRIAQFHKSKPDYVNLRKLSLDISQFMTLAPQAKKKLITDMSILATYMKAEGSEFQNGIPDRTAYILTYEDIQGRKYCTVTKGNVIPGSRGILLKNTLMADYSSGNLPIMPRSVIESSDT